MQIKLLKMYRKYMPDLL